MAIDAYLQIDGINGESTDDKHKDWIEVSHVVSTCVESNGGARNCMTRATASTTPTMLNTST